MKYTNNNQSCPSGDHLLNCLAIGFVLLCEMLRTPVSDWSQKMIFEWRRSDSSLFLDWRFARLCVLARPGERQIWWIFAYIAFFHLDSSWSYSIYFCLFSGVIWRGIAFSPVCTSRVITNGNICNEGNVRIVEPTVGRSVELRERKTKFLFFEDVYWFDDQSTVNV